MQCVRETEILVKQQPPQGVLVCDHAGLVINVLGVYEFRWFSYERGTPVSSQLMITGLPTGPVRLQGYLAHKKPHPPGTLQ